MRREGYLLTNLELLAFFRFNEINHQIYTLLDQDSPEFQINCPKIQVKCYFKLETL